MAVVPAYAVRPRMTHPPPFDELDVGIEVNLEQCTQIRTQPLRPPELMHLYAWAGTLFCVKIAILCVCV